MKPAISAMLLVAFSTSGCGGDRHQDLDAFFDEVRGSSVAGIPPLPDVVPFEPDADRLVVVRDPFQPLISSGSQSPATVPVAAPVTGPLARYALSTIRLVTTRHDNSGPVAIIVAPNGDLYRLAVGDAIGPTARIVEISDAAIVVEANGRRQTLRESPES